MVRPDTYPRSGSIWRSSRTSNSRRASGSSRSEVVDPLVELARTHTSPSIERSVLMRMGIDSLTLSGGRGECEKRGLLGHGAGHVVLRLHAGVGVRRAGGRARLADGEGWDIAEAKWGGAR